MKDKLEIEILWTLKLSPTHYISTFDMIKKNNRLENNDEFKEKLRFLYEEKLIDKRASPGIGIHYLLKKKGNDLIWNGSTWQQIFKLILLIHPEQFTGKEIVRFIRKSEDEVYKGIEYLRNRRKWVDAYDENGERYWILSKEGENQNITKNSIINLQKDYEHSKLLSEQSTNSHKIRNIIYLIAAITSIISFVILIIP